MRFFEMAVAIDQHHEFKPFNRSQRCRLQSFTHFDYNILELSQTNLAHSLKQAFEVSSIHRSFSTPCFSVSTKVEEDFDASPRVEIVGGHGARHVHALVVEVAIAMTSGVNPIPVSSGLGGAYFLRSRNDENIAVVKPIDEEPLAFNNPKGFNGLMLGQPGMKRSIRVGETGIRELAAYLLDHDGFADVPPTALVKITHVGFHVNDSVTLPAPPYKIASLQRFVDHDFDAGELGPSGFSVSSVHRIGIFDIRLLNLDRHAGNMLVKKNYQHEQYAAGVAELVPIDHGLCLPEWLDDPYFEWLHWPQSSVPFSQYEYEYISNLDPLKDAELLRTELPSLKESSVRVLILCTIFLKRAAASGLSLSDIGEMMTRDCCGKEPMSMLEELCTKAKASIVNISSDDDSKENNKLSRGGKEEAEMFHLDDESEFDCNEALVLPQLLNCRPAMAKQPTIPSCSSVGLIPLSPDATLSPLYEENYCEDNDSDKYEGSKPETIASNDEIYSGIYQKAESCLVRNTSPCETEGVTLGDMSENEWELFLEYFDKLLPEALRGTKRLD